MNSVPVVPNGKRQPRLTCLFALLGGSLLAFSLPQQVIAKEMCKSMTWSVRAIDPTSQKGGKEVGVEGIHSKGFKTYIKNVSDHLKLKLKNDPYFCSSASTKPAITLLFVKIPLIYTSLETPLSDTSYRPKYPMGNSSLESPWVKVTVNPKSKDVEAIFIWNERQFIIDQALRDGANLGLQLTATPISQNEYQQYVEDWEATVIASPSPDAKKKALGVMSTRLPPDIYWLFLHAGQSDRGPFSSLVYGARTSIVEEKTGAHIELIEGLLNQFFAGDRKRIEYNSIKELSK